MIRNTFIVREYETAVLFRHGKLVGTLMPGRHVRWGGGYDIESYDLRMTQMVVATQDVMDRDGISIRLSARVDYRVADAEEMIRSTSSAYAVLYGYVQEAMREIIPTRSYEELMLMRNELGSMIEELVQADAAAIGLELIKVAARDIGTTGDIRRASAELLVAQKQSAAALERARGEQAALRSLANAARIMAGNPALLQLRWIQALDQVENATIIVSPGTVPLGVAVGSE